MLDDMKRTQSSIMYILADFTRIQVWEPSTARSTMVYMLTTLDP